MSQIKFKHSPFKVIVLSYLLLTFLLSFFYMLPISTTKPLSFIDALFLSTSGMSVTGLSTIDIAENLTRIGQLVLLVQIQIGGIGIMVVWMTVLLFLKQHVSLSQQTIISFDQNQNGLKSIKKLSKYIIGLTLIVQSFGFLLFFPTINNQQENVLDSIFISSFHSVSSFTGAGFDLFGDSLQSFSSNTLFVLVTSLLILGGALGFPTLLEIISSNNKKKSLFTKTNIFIHSFLLLIGFCSFLLFEFSNAYLNFSIKEKFINALFLSVTSRNAGLTTIDISSVSLSSLIILMGLMFIGASASSCGGGIRTTTFAVLVAKMISAIKGNKDVVLFKKNLYEEDINKAYLIFCTFFLLFFFSVIFVSHFEKNFSLEQIAFEVMSALTTTGLSTGITSELTSISKLWLIKLMIIGRIGIVALIYTIIKPKERNSKYLKEHLIVG